MVLKFELRGRVFKDEATGIHVSRCNELDICSQGRTQEEAMEALEDALRLYIKHCMQRGILESILAGRGIRLRPEGEDVIPANSADGFSIEVPLELLADAHKQGQIGGGRISWRP